MKNKAFSDYGDFPSENKRFDTTSLVGGVLMCFMTKEQNRKSIYVRTEPEGHQGFHPQALNT